ncbi:MAG: hypothetical protein HY392_00670 [Candidatus Diapherotrites archaeon]|nr:hypothetical protein [Candidatus Diapherotrites archaeon]
MNLKKLALYRLAEQNRLSVEEAKTLNALFEKPLDFMQIAQATNLETKEITEALRQLKKKSIVQQDNGKYSADFLWAMEKLMQEKEELLAKA